ncbi:MAG: HlyD family efflux transporter periplasmic adaptor subunit [Magnetococcales bacterium]|nr:HlyD family efflux transporter periplasmic adaptor subunit [Magnetococcales bacterium]
MTASAPAPPPATTPTAGRSRFKKLASATLIFLAMGLGYTWYDHTYGQFHEETDDAYVGANLVYVTAQVNGTVIALDADDNHPAKQGQILVRLDPADATIALEEAAARLGEVVRQVRQYDRTAGEAAAVVAQRKTDLQRAQGNLTRRKSLSGGEALSVEELAHAKEAVAAAQDALTVAERQLAVARVPIDGTTLRTHPSVRRARTAYVQALLTRQRHTIPAPIDGFIARRAVQIGQRVTAGTPLLAIVPLEGAWVDANVKESQLRNIRIGQPAMIHADLYGSPVTYHGQVASISPGSGAAFSLLPPQNATGNWIKIVQRVPVRIALDPSKLQTHPLRVGLSTDVDIDTHARTGAVNTALPLPNAVHDTKVFDAWLKEAEEQADALLAHELDHDA